MSALISYSHLDRQLAIRMSRVLSEFKLDNWWDNKLELSSVWNYELEDKLARSTSIVVLWTPNSYNSDWVKREASIAVDNSKLIQLNFFGTKLPSSFARLQAAEIPTWETNTFPRGIRLALNEIAKYQNIAPVLSDYSYLFNLKISDEKVCKFVEDKKHRQGYFPKLDGPLYKDIWEMQISGKLKLYDELYVGSKYGLGEERYYELLEYLSEKK